MTLEQTLRELESCGTAQNRKIYARHGVGPNMYGVSFSHLGALKKKIKVDHALAGGLWKSGNHDACVLGAMVADPAQATVGELNAWLKATDNCCLADQLAAFVARTKFAQAKAAQWSKASAALTSQTGWAIVGFLAASDEDLDDAFFAPYLNAIESGIHTRPNRTREAMNRTLIAIGCRNGRLRKEAERVARAIGTVDVDHGETSCETPDAVGYIRKTWDHRAAKGAAKGKVRAS